jgi:tetratricopeptide (TPR) repeat protein
MRPNHTILPPLRLVMVLSSVLVACTGGMPSRDSRVWTETTEIGFDRKTTDGDIAASNLKSQVSSLEAQLNIHPHSLSLRIQLVDTLLLRTQFLGLYDDFDRALSLAQETAQIHPENAQATLTLARVLGALHRFDEAIEFIQSLPASPELDSRLAGFKAAQGREYTRDYLLKREAVAVRKDFTSLTNLANAAVNMNNYVQAEKLYKEALAQYQDVSPIPVAWIMFQRGVMWAEKANRPDKALVLYREAVARLPGYIVANVHLAELEAEYGDKEKALELLSKIVDTTQDPEPAGYLGELLMDQDPDRAMRRVFDASTQYDLLLSSHRAAFADHGAEFFAGPGNDVDRALRLAMYNLEHRDTDRAYAVAIETALAAKQPALACELSGIMNQREVNPALSSLILDIQDSCVPKF